ncbi:MAG: Crp/Fnr family transcriptional regulator [Thermoflexaceae bacterium]|jgi:CRP-like cAMP-binding protein|nr:Crp/Fnr family transcriptional regulator [Thermoflexaceae bacterium]
MTQNSAGPEQVVRDLPLLARLPRDDRQALATRARLRSYPSGTTIFREGEPGDSMHVIVEGRVSVSVSNGAGGEATIASVGPGDCVGELSLLDGRPRSAAAIAATATKTMVVTRDSFVEWLAERPPAALALLETLSLRLRRTNEAMSDLIFLDLPHRLAKQIISLADLQQRLREGAPGGSLRIAVTQGELAAMLGVSRESVNKQLNVFQRDGLIALARGAVILTDDAGLRQYL